MHSRIADGLMLYVSGSMSAKSGLAPTRAMHPTVAKNVYGVVMTASPGPIPSAMRIASNASVTDETPKACGDLQYPQIAFSNGFTFGPIIIRYLARHLPIV